MRRLPAPVTVITTYSDTPLDPRALWPLMERAQKAYLERMAKSRPENKRKSTKPGVRAQVTP